MKNGHLLLLFYIIVTICMYSIIMEINCKEFLDGNRKRRLDSVPSAERMD